MTPTPQEPTLRAGEVGAGLDGESIVISGMSGLYPMSNSVTEFSKILYDKINPVVLQSNCKNVNHPELSGYLGKVPNLDRFDYQFFKVHHRQADCMDPMSRKVLEQSYQAIYDAGLNPKDLYGKTVGVFIGASLAEMEFFFTEISNKEVQSYKMTGGSKTMFANRISYWLNVKGPSLTMDDACCGSTLALEKACSAIKNGICESAIVGGTNLCLFPESQVHFNRCIKISPGAETKSFDQNADGCTKSEAIGVIFLQKAKDALRVYAEVVHVKNEFTSTIGGETGQVFGFIRNPDVSASFMKEFYKEADVTPQAVEYIEACGSATPEGDKAELQSIEKVFCDNRTEPLLVGSVISNVGYTDSASGITALTKVLLGYHHGLIASNLNCETPRQDIAAIRNGRMNIVTEHHPFRGTYAAVNCLSVTGVNSHVLLRGCYKEKDMSRYNTSIPRLVMVSARQEEHIPHIFEELKSHPIDAEQLALLQNIHSANISGHLGRGYIILDTNKDNKTISLAEQTAHSDETNRPLWFVYSGMGSQWAGMGAQLMQIPIFAAAVERCRTVLEPNGIDIIHIITSPDKTIFDNVLNSFVGIAAIQIGLTDILRELQLNPDKIIGHSVGELGCAYADGCLSAEEMILSAYCRGMASNETTLIRGAMAAVGLGHKQLSKLCPPSIEIACHNSSTSSTISGPEKDMHEFVATLTAKGIFAKEVPSANIAYHSSYIADAGPNLLRNLSKIIKNPKSRSERWLSTSIPEERWNEPIAKYCSPEYFTNNLLSSVYFEETCELISNNAVLIEIAPHGLLQAILKRSLPESCLNIPLTKRGHENNTLVLLEAIGKLYVEGFCPQVQAIYPKIEFPVSTGTPHLSQFVKWNHDDSWSITAKSHCASIVKTASASKCVITKYDDEYLYLNGNVIQGNVLYPYAAALVTVWNTLANAQGFKEKTISVKFLDVHLYSQPILHDEKKLNLNISVQRGSGEFQVLNGTSRVASGFISTVAKPTQSDIINISENLVISSEEIYQHLGSKGYVYRDMFQSIHSANESLSSAQILWKDNWVTLIDGLLQLNALRRIDEGLLELSHIRKLTIDISKHLNSIQQSTNGATVIKAEVDEVLDCSRCGGVMLHNVKYRKLSLPTQGIFKLVAPTLSGNIVNVSWENGTAETALQIGSVADVDTLHWEEAQTAPGSGVKVMVEYAGINTSDAKRAAGVIPLGDNVKHFGMDFSGLTERGERVMGLVRNGAASTVVSALPELLWPVPGHWSLEEAATVPLAYVQAFYCLCIKGELQSGFKVLVHGAAGALGQAAISIALAHGCQVFATVADGGKKKFLLRLFPELHEDAIGNSRDDSFGDMVLNATNGSGCNIILSCVRNDLKNISLKCAAFSGITIDTVQIQNRDIYKYGMFHMTRQRSYMATDFYSIFDSGKKSELTQLQKLVSEGIALGYVRPLSRVTFSPHDAPRAFRLLAASRHRGRVLLRLRDSFQHVQPRIVCSPDRSHLIIWDGCSFGLDLADRLIASGARNLSIHCLNPKSHYRLKLRLWQKLGVNVKVRSEKFDNSNTVSLTLEDTNKCAPVEGIYLTAISGEIQDNAMCSIIEHVDSTSRKICPLLKYFAVITVNSDIGQQTCLSRSKDGYPATVLSLPTFEKVFPKHEAVMEFSWNRSAVDVTEVALQSKKPVLAAEPQAIEKPSLIKLIPCLADADDENSTLRDIGASESISFIKCFLSDVFHVSLDDDDILMLTKKKILEMELNLLEGESNFEEKSGLDTFFSYVDDDEIDGTADFMPLTTNASSKKKFDIDINKTSLFIIPGLEGNHLRFRELCLRLKLPAFVLQPGIDHVDETPKELAARYYEILQKKFKLTTNFYLLGYECGIFEAMELASILEDHGLSGTVYLVGDGPKEMKALLNKELSLFNSEEALQEGVVRHMFTLMTRDSSASLERALRGCSSWRERVDACVRILLVCGSHTAQYARGVIETAYARIGAVRRYSEELRALRSRIVLLRARPDDSRADSGKECSLQRYSQTPIIVEDLAAPMAHTTTDLRTPAAINRYLDKEILATHNLNLCETYLDEA